MTAAISPPNVARRPNLRLVPTGDEVVVPVDVSRILLGLAVLALVVVVVVGAVAQGRGAFAGAVPDRAVPPAGATVTARPGDTLWSIARRLHPDSDVRRLVDDMVLLNGTTIQIGQEVRLPVGA